MDNYWAYDVEYDGLSDDLTDAEDEADVDVDPDDFLDHLAWALDDKGLATHDK